MICGTAASITVEQLCMLEGKEAAHRSVPGKAQMVVTASFC